MNFELPNEIRMLNDWVTRFLRDERLPLKTAVLQLKASGKQMLLPQKHARLDTRSRALELQGLNS